MGGLFKQYKTNSEAETNGIRVELTEATNDDGTVPTFILARMGKSNKAYSKSLEAKTRPHRRQIEMNIMKNEKAEEIFLDVFVDTVLKGWENVQAEDGSLMQYTRENAINLLTALPDVYERLQDESKLAANFLANQREEEAKN